MTQRDDPNRQHSTPKEGDRTEQLTALEADMRQTRSAISGDLQTLGARLSPEHLKEEAKELMAEAKHAAVDTLHEAKDVAAGALREAKDNALESVSAKVSEIKGDVRRAQQETLGFVRENAVPLALIGAGVAWLVAQRRAKEADWNRQYRWGAAGDAARGYPSDSTWEGSEPTQSRARELVAQAGDRTRQWAHGAEQKLGDAAGRARDFAEKELHSAERVMRDAEREVAHAAGKARDFAGRELRHARDYTMHASETHPIAVGAAALALGIGVGLALPATRRERELMGSERERLFGGAKEIAHDIGHAATEATRDMKQSLIGARGSANP
jgi:hypothetical protein